MNPDGGHPAQLKVGIVGTGRVGAVLGAALHAAGHRVVAVSGLSEASRERALRLLPGVPAALPEGVFERAEFVLLAVPGEELPGLVRGLTAAKAWKPAQIVAHTSARFGVDILAPARARHVLTLALHPAMRFTGSSADVARLSTCRVGVTTTPDLRAVAEALVLEMGAEPLWVPPEARGHYAAAMALTGDYLGTLVEEAAQLLEGGGIEDWAGLLHGYLHSALDNALTADPVAISAGARGDAETLERDLAVIGDAAPDARDVYLSLARAAAARSLGRGGLRHADVDRLLDVLARPSTRTQR